MEGQIVNEKESGSQQCVLPCPLEGASPRQLKAVSNAKQIKKKKIGKKSSRAWVAQRKFIYILLDMLQLKYGTFSTKGAEG